MNLISVLPHVNAFLNSLSGVLLVTGYILIRRRQLTAHRAVMLSAFTTSSLFLLSYLVYHFSLAYLYHQGPTRFTGAGVMRPIYFTVLISHTILAVVIAPFILVTLSRALRGKFSLHKRLARWTFPVWLYVSVTGVFVYLMLYQFYPAR
jgi:uncharacterized membrane protein YozB (DUF420 family)